MRMCAYTCLHTRTHLWAYFACVCACVFVSDVSDTFSIHSGLAYEVSDIFLGYRWQLLTVVFS